MGAQLHARSRPRVEVVSSRHGAAGTVGLADGPELVERRGALDGRFVHALRLVNVVGSAVRGDRALLGGARGRVVGTEALDDVVLDERVGGPTVDGEVTVADGGIVAREGDGPKRQNGR